VTTGHSSRPGSPVFTGPRAALRVLLASRSIIDQHRTANRNALTALLRSADLDVDARKPLSDAHIRVVAAWRIGRNDASATAVTIARREARGPSCPSSGWW
jgi:hypothetical protein